MESTGRRSRSQLVVLGAALLAFVLLASQRLDVPGLYADEMLFAPATLRALGDCAIEANVSRAAPGCFPLYLDPPYLGALKAWLYVPVFAAFDVSAASVRGPAIALSALALLLLWWGLRRPLGGAFATLAACVCACDPLLAFHSRLDWGPFVLSNLLKLAALGALLRWVELGRARWLATALALLLLGVYDKLNFLWVVAAYGAGACAAWPAAIAAHLRGAPRVHAALIAAALASLAYVVLAYVLPAERLALGAPFDLVAQAQQLLNLYDATVTLAFAPGWVGEHLHAAPAWPRWLLAIQLGAALLLSVRRPWRDDRLRGRWQLLLFLGVVIVALMVQLALTRQVGGTHHVMVLWPYVTLHLLLLVQLAVATWRPALPVSIAPAALAAIALATWAGAGHVGLWRLWAGGHGFAGRFDPALPALSRALAGERAATIISTDWGLHQPLVSLAAPEQRARFRDWWPVFNEPWAGQAERNRHLGERDLRGDSVWLAYVAERGVLPATHARIEEFAARWGGCVALAQALAGSDGRPLYEIWRFHPAGTCAASPVAASAADSEAEAQ